MMTLQCWRQLVPYKLREQFMNSRLWHSYSEEWVWELAIVDEEIISNMFNQLNEFQQEVLLELLNDLLLTPQLEEELVPHLVRRLGRPSQQCKQALQLFSEAGFIVVFEDPWRGLILWMPLPVFNNWRNMLRVPVYLQPYDATSSSDHCRYEHVVSIAVRFTFFLQQLHKTPLKFTKNGELSKASIKPLQQKLEQFGGIAGIEHVWKKQLQGTGGIVQFMLELAFNLGIVKQDRYYILLIKEKLIEWLALTQARQDDIVWQWLIQLLATADVPASSLLSLLDIRRDSRWYAYANPAHQSPVTLELLELWAECGFLSYCLNEEEGVVYIRRSEAAQAEHRLHIEQNGELILLPGTMPYILWNGLEIAEVVSVQEVIILRLTLHSLRGAHRYSIERIRSWLQGYTNGQLPMMIDQLLQLTEGAETDGVPDDLPQSINEDKQYDAAMIELFSAAEMGNVVLFEMCSLRDWGIFCRHPLGQLQDIALASPEVLQKYYSSAEHERSTLPRSWQQELRDYHLSTKQQMIDTAIRLGVCVNISTMRRCYKLVPFLLERGSEASAVHALSYREPEQPPLRIELTSIEAIQLAIE